MNRILLLLMTSLVSIGLFEGCRSHQEGIRTRSDEPISVCFTSADEIIESASTKAPLAEGSTVRVVVYKRQGNGAADVSRDTYEAMVT